MRTTLTLDADVARLIEAEVHRRRAPFKQVVNEALRTALSTKRAPKARRAFRVTPHRTALRPGLDPAGFNHLADELEDGALLAKARRSR
jgi:hypothetical protein